MRIMISRKSVIIFTRTFFFFYLFLDSRILERYFDTLSTIETADEIKAGEIIGTPAGLQ